MFFTKLKILLITLILFASCGGQKNKIPYVYVDITLDLNKPEFYDLNEIGGYVYITGGFNGIVVYRISRDEFKAYERACPYDPQCGRVVVVKDSSFLIDSCCGSKFSLPYDGSVLKGPAEQPLREYQTYFYENSNLLRITNQ